MFGLGYWFYSNRSLPVDLKEINSIAVLPFENGSGDANLDYLSDGLSESLIDKLSQLPQLKVIARNSSFKYRGANIDLQDVANKLGVQAVVMGKVLRVGDDLSVRVEMINIGENRQLWSEQYNRKSSNILVVQQEIAQAASEKLRLKLTGAQEQQLAELNTVNPQAYELLLKGRYYANTPGAGNRQKAAEYFNQAISVDPNYALAYSELSQIYALLLVNSMVSPTEFRPKAEEAARKALELNENLPQAHLAMAGILRNSWNWAAAEVEYKRAIELNPNLGAARRGYSSYLSNIGRNEEAIAEAKRSRELDPLSLGSTTQVTLSFLYARRYDEAIEASQTLELSKQWKYLSLGYAYAGKGMFKEAIANYRESIREGNTSPSVQIYLGQAYAQAGD
ncbi:MAG: hypothetical protein LC768_03850, partial [Acidobacteria bacterium]|nr:hypothetical protein [Acidobacteriota bacterium]